MFDMEARKIVEALRSGVPSRAVGRYFSESRHSMMKSLSDDIQKVCEDSVSEGKIISGKYGEGKTHLLHTAYDMAHTANMVVSYISLGKETPIDKLHVFYPKLIAGTFLPGREQPGFLGELEALTPGNPIASEILLYATRKLTCDKLYYLFKALLNTEDSEEKFLLMADLMGDFISNSELKKIYKRIFGETAKFNISFSKTKHIYDYLLFMSHLFRQLGYSGWTILVDELELMGRMGKKARLKCYDNIYEFVFPQKELKGVYSLFVVSASYTEDVIDGKHEFNNLLEVYPEGNERIKNVINCMANAEQLAPLTKSEISLVLEKIRDFHAKAYSWTPDISTEQLEKTAKTGGYLLRTKVRVVIEYLDQLYQYNEDGGTSIGELAEDTYEEVPELD